MHENCPSSPLSTGPTVKTPVWVSGLDMRLARGSCSTQAASVCSVFLSKKKLTGLLAKLDPLDCCSGVGEGREQLKDNVPPRFTSPVDGTTDRNGRGKGGNERVGEGSDK